MSTPNSKKNKTNRPSNTALPNTANQTASSAPKKQEENFVKYITDHKDNRYYFFGGLIINLVLFLTYKYCYPLPDFFSDAQGYVLAASRDTKVFYRPFGYSHFLQIVHDITSSHYFTVFLQYFFNVVASLFCFFSVDFLFRFSNKKIKFLSWLFMTVNPFFLVLANQIVSDIIFSGLTIIWFSLLLWIFKKKQWWCLLAQLLVLYLVFHIRYNAIYFPFLVTLLLLIAPGMRIYYKITGIAASLLLIFGAYNNIKRENLETTGADVFAGFSGWQMANNALFIYKHVEVATQDFEDPQLQLLDKFVKKYIDAVPAEDRKKIENGELTTGVYLWDTASPLKKFAFNYSAQNRVPYLVSWYRVSELYGQYGLQIIKDHPFAYLKYYLFNNVGYYMVPAQEFMEHYDLTKTQLNDVTKAWFDIKESKLHARFPNLQHILTYVYPWLHAFLVIFCLIVPLVCLIRKRKTEAQWDYVAAFPILFWYLFLGANIMFSILAAVVVLRYEAAFFVIAWSLPMYFLDSAMKTFGSQPAKANAAEPTI